MGFFIQEPEQGHVIGQFPHLFPASIAIGYGLDGLTGARRTRRRLGDPRRARGVFRGRAAGRPHGGRAPPPALLALHVIEVWFARYPNAEVVMQALLFAALLANARAHVDGDRVLRAGGRRCCSACCCSCASTPCWASPASSAGAGAARSLAGGRVRWSFVATLAAVDGAGRRLHARPDARVRLPADRVRLEPAVVAVRRARGWRWSLALAALVARRAQRRAHRRPSGAARRSLVAARGRAPRPSTRSTCASRAASSTDYDAYALRTFTNLYLTLPALLAALFGYALLARRAFWRDPALFVTVAIFALFFFYKIRIVPEQFWMARRFLPVILPGALLFAAAAALAGTRSGTRRDAAGARRARRRVPRRCSALQYARAARPVLRPRRVRGHHPEDRADRRDDRRRRPAGRRVARRVGHPRARAAARLHLRPQRPAAARRALPDKSAFALVPRLGAQPLRARAVHGRRRHRAAVAALGRAAASPASASRCRSTRRSRTRYPAVVRQKEFDYSLYEFVAAARRRAGGDRPRRRHAGRPARAPLPRQGDERRAHVPLVARHVVRLADGARRRAAAR